MIPAQRMAARAAAWAEADAAVRAVIVYGSVAQGTAGEESDLDLIVVAEPGQRDALWARRDELSELLLGSEPAYAQELPWQRPYRYQSWTASLAALDLTLDEERVQPFGALSEGFAALADKGGVAARLRSDLAGWQPPEFDAPAHDGGTWAWLDYLHGKLGHGEDWLVRCGVMDTLGNRVVPLLGAASHSARRQLVPADLARLHEAAPASAEPAELRRSLRATAQLYGEALSCWSQRTGRTRPDHPLAAAIIRRLGAEP